MTQPTAFPLAIAKQKRKSQHDLRINRRHGKDVDGTTFNLSERRMTS
jgi:hypothetical protein